MDLWFGLESFVEIRTWGPPNFPQRYAALPGQVRVRRPVATGLERRRLCLERTAEMPVFLRAMQLEIAEAGCWQPEGSKHRLGNSFVRLPQAAEMQACAPRLSAEARLRELVSEIRTPADEQAEAQRKVLSAGPATPAARGRGSLRNPQKLPLEHAWRSQKEFAHRVVAGASFEKTG